MIFESQAFPGLFFNSHRYFRVASMTPAKISFSNRVPIIRSFDGVAEMSNYCPLPDDWFLALADVVNSTAAIEEGRYKAVNMAGASVICALSNHCKYKGMPYAFGGDGAVAALPKSYETSAIKALSELRTWTADALSLDLRVATVPVVAVRRAGFDVLVSFYRPSDAVSYAMFSGGGMSWAEAEMKAGRFNLDAAGPGSKPDLTGLSCRWDPVRAREGAIISLIVSPVEWDQSDSFADLITQIISIVANEDREAHPLPVGGPPVTMTVKGIAYENSARRNSLSGGAFLLLQTAIAVVLDRLNLSIGNFNARAYRAEISRNCDFRKFDDGLKMTLDLGEPRINELKALLEDAVTNRICKYGMHRQDAALMTCFVPDLQSRDHIHFIDGAGGGYALAARLLKQRFESASFDS